MIETPFNYTGSKFKLLQQLLPEFDYTKPYFVDLFTGGGSVYTNVVDKYTKLIANDIIKDLIGIHQSLLNSDSIIEETKSICPSKGNPELFGKLREDYNSNPTPAKLWALMLSSTNNMMRFNQRFKYNQTYGDRGWNNNTDKKVEIFTNHIRQYKDSIRFKSVPFDQLEISSDKITVTENMDFQEVIEKYDSPTTYFYCDPPYYSTEKYYANHDFGLETHERLANTLKATKGKFSLSYYDFPQLSEWFPKDEYRWESKSFYKAAMAKAGKSQTKGTELLIMNY